jgi:ATP-dependent Clp protease adaptor protein ClpS
MGSKKHGNPPRQPELALEIKPLMLMLQMPGLYRVYLLNDDYTPMNFVVEVLERYFAMDQQIATEIMLQVHQKGKGICGLYTREIAETKVIQVNEYAKRNQYPLLCKMEEAGIN